MRQPIYKSGGDNLNRIDGSDTWKVGEVVDNGKRNMNTAM